MTNKTEEQRAAEARTARDQQVAHDQQAARERDQKLRDQKARDQQRGRPGVGEPVVVGPGGVPPRAPLEPIGADSPLVAPHVEALAQRDVTTAAEIERQKVTQSACYQKLADCDAVVQALTVEAAAARDRLMAALETRKSAFEEVAKLGPIPAIFPADALAPGEPQVLMFFPRPVTLNDGGRTGSFPAGIHAVPERLANHQYLIDNGVRPYSG